MSFLKNAINNDKGFFQGGKSFGGQGFLGNDGVLGQVANNFKDKPYAGIFGVCPYTGKPLQSATEQASGVSDSISQAQDTGINPQSNRYIQFAPQTGKFGALNTQLFGGNKKGEMGGGGMGGMMT